MATKNLSEKENFSRLTRLLIDKGTQVFRETFHLKFPRSTLAVDLNRSKPILKKLRYKVINKSQWKLLYPSSGSPDSKNFDITLLTLLLRNICGLASPANGWDNKPAAADTSISANILRIKNYRNEVYAHITSTEIDDIQFNRLWQDISIALVAMGVQQCEIDEIKEAPLSPEEDSYIQQLEEWKKSDDEMMKEIKEVRKEFKEVTKEFKEVKKMIEKQGRSECDNLLLQLAHCNFQGNIELLAKSCYPGTRQSFLRELQVWFKSKKSDSRTMILTAGPGVGKSVFAAKVCQLYQKKGKLAASHFCKYSNSDYRDPHIMLQSLASQMCQSVSGFKEKLLEQLQRPHSRQTFSDAFRVLLNDPLYALKSREPMMIVIDALDESENSDKSELLDVIANEFPKLPEWIKVFVTSRPELPVKKKLSHLNPREINAGDADNEKDLFDYLRGCLSDKFKDEHTFKALVRKCQGSFLYAYYVQLELRGSGRKSLTMENIDSFLPKGISSFYEKQFEALEKYLHGLSPKSYDFKQFLAIIAAAEGPLPLAFLPECLGLPEDANFHLRKGINNIMSAYLPVYDDCLTVYHKSLADWLKSDGYEEHPFTVAVGDGNEWLWKKCKMLFQEIKSNFPVKKLSQAMKYALDHGAFHLLALAERPFFQNGYELLVDFTIVFSKLYRIYSLVDEWRMALFSRVEMDLKLKIKFHWHIMLFLLMWTTEDWCYCESVVNSCPFGVFSQQEIEIAKSILRNREYSWWENLNVSHEDTEIPVLAVELLPTASVASRISISPNKELLAVPFRSGLVTIFKLPSLQTICSFKTNEDTSFNGPEITCSFSPNGTTLVTSDMSEVVKLWDVDQQIPLAHLRAGTPVNQCTFSKSGSFIMGKQNCSEREIGDGFDRRDVFAVWDAITLKRVNQREIPQSEIPLTTRTPPVNECEDRILYITYNKLKVIDSQRQTVVAECRVPVNGLFSNNFVPCVFAGEFVVVLRHDALFVIKTPSRSTSLPTWPSPPTWPNPRVTCCSFSPDGSFLASCVNDEWVKIVDVKTANIVQSFKIPAGEKQGCWWSKESLWIVNVTQDSTSLLKYPSDETQKFENPSNSETVLRPEPTKLLSFSDGVLVFKCDADDVVLATKISGDTVQPSQILQHDNVVECAAVGGRSCILTASVFGFVLWKEDMEGCCRWSPSLVGSFYNLRGTNYGQLACSIDSNVKFAYFVITLYAKIAWNCVILNLHSFSNSHVRGVDWRIKPTTYISDNDTRVQLLASDHFMVIRTGDGNIAVVDPTPQVCSHIDCRHLGFHSPLPLCAGTTSLPITSGRYLLATTDESGHFQFLKLHYNTDKDQNKREYDYVMLKQLPRR